MRSPGDHGFFLGVDVGGTFTDVVLGHRSGQLAVAKVPTTPEDPRQGVAEGCAQVLDIRGVSPGAVSRLVHGTTLATNAILAQRGARVALVTTAGFGDLAALGREFRHEDERFNLFFATPAPPVPRDRTFEVVERIDARGNVVVPADGDQVAQIAHQVTASGAQSVAVCLLHAYANSTHEQLAAEACRAALGPGAFVVTSAEVWPELREYERAMTTIMCAYVGPMMSDYLAGLRQRLAAMGIGCPIEVMESSGGIMSADLAARRPVYTVESGGAAGVMAAGSVGRLISAPQVISFDMGGTTAKTGVVRGGKPDIAHDFYVGGTSSSGGARRSQAGFPLKIPVVDMAEVGAGGGSIAAVDAGGGLGVGPRSAGSVPGPACYGRGGADPTVTDANLVLGYLRAGELSGGVSVATELAEKALEQVAAPLGLDLAGAARAVHDVANAKMAAAIQMVTVRRGVDPRDFVLISFGGAGPMHAAELAATFGIAQVVVPRAAGVASAVGLITSDLVVERVRTAITDLRPGQAGSLARLFSELETQALAELAPGSGEVQVHKEADLRYRGQAHQLTVALAPGPVTPGAVESLGQAFAARYHQVYGIDRSAPIELVNLRVRAVAVVDKPQALAEQGTGEDPANALVGERPVRFGIEATPTPVYHWAELATGTVLDGPAVVEGSDTTVVVPPRCTASADRWGNLHLHGEAAKARQ